MSAPDLATVEAELRARRTPPELDERRYGVCDGCGGPIASKRLAAAPESLLCIECARRAP